MVLSNVDFHGIDGKLTVQEVNSRTSPELTTALAGLDEDMLVSGSVVVHQGVTGRFREMRPKLVGWLDEAFEPTPLERLRKAGHTLWAFEPEDGSTSDQVVILGDPYTLALRAKAG